MIRYYISGAVSQVFSTLQRQRVLEYGLRHAETVSSGEIISIFSERVTNSASVLHGISQLIITSTTCILFFMYGTKKAPIEMTIGVFSLLILMFPLKRFNASIVRSGDGLRNEWGNVNHTLIQGLKNHFFFKIYNLIETEIYTAKKYLEEYDTHYLRYFKISALKNHTPNIIGIFIICSISFISVRYIHTRPIILLSFFYIFIRFTQGLSEISSVMSNLKLHFKNFIELYHWNIRLEQATLKKETLSLPPQLTKDPFIDDVNIVINNLTFGFPGEPNLFEKINCSVKRGEVLLIKGQSGSGKSTLLMIILGYLSPKEGTIKYNNYDVAQVLPHWCDIVGYVGPEPYIIAGTIKENLLFGNISKEKISDDILLSAMKKAQLDTTRFHLDYRIEEQATLSTGQKQRLSIARAILRKPKLLILDEATANLDGDTEKRFTDSIKDLLNEVTTIVISHKPSFDQIATSVLILGKK